MAKLLTRIKAVFEPRPPAEPPSEVDETPVPVVPEAVERGTPAPIALLEDLAPADEMPATALEAPTVTEEPPADDEPKAAARPRETSCCGSRAIASRDRRSR